MKGKSGSTSGRGRVLGLWMCTALVVGNMVGSGVFLLPASLGAYGGISIVGWLITLRWYQHRRLADHNGRRFGARPYVLTSESDDACGGWTICVYA
jgi:hypothetical protein